MAVPAIPDAGKPWLTWAQGIDTEARKVAAKADATDARFTDTRTPTDGSVTNAKVAAGISADKLVDGTTNHTFTAADDTKLTGIAAGATANATDAQLRDRATHTGTQTAATISDLGSAVQGVITSGAVTVFTPSAVPASNLAALLPQEWSTTP